MLWDKHPSALIAGAGPVGLFAALALTRRGIRVQIFDREIRTGAHSYALALHPESLRLFEMHGLRDRILDEACRVRSIVLHDEDGNRKTISIRGIGADFPFVSVMRQDILEELLEEALADTGVDVHWNHEVSMVEADDRRVVATIDRLDTESRGYGVAHVERVVTKSRETEVPFMVAADGLQSDLRTRLGIEFPEIAPPSTFAVFEFKSGQELGDEMHVILSQQRAAVCWPMPGGFCRWSFQIPDEHDRGFREKDRFAIERVEGDHPELEDEALARLLKERAPWFKGEIKEIAWRKRVRFEHRLASSFGEGRVWLLGDAAHTTGPVGVQSMNVGFREANGLADALADVLLSGREREQLEAFGRAARDEWKVLLAVDNVPESSDGAASWIARHRRQLLESIPASGENLRELLERAGLSVSRSTPVSR
ncbi:MAG: FAD-dependent oxidoreductase [Bacteroidota bacterium]